MYSVGFDVVGQRSHKRRMVSQAVCYTVACTAGLIALATLSVLATVVALGG